MSVNRIGCCLNFDRVRCASGHFRLSGVHEVRLWYRMPISVAHFWSTLVTCHIPVVIGTVHRGWFSTLNRVKLE